MILKEIEKKDVFILIESQRNLCLRTRGYEFKYRINCDIEQYLKTQGFLTVITVVT